MQMDISDAFLLSKCLYHVNINRYNTIGMVDNVLFVVYTGRNENIRLISARRATALERSIYYDQDSHFK